MKRGRILPPLFLACILLLTSCGSATAARAALTCPVVLEEGEGYTAESYTAAPPQGGGRRLYPDPGGRLHPRRDGL